MDNTQVNMEIVGWAKYNCKPTELIEVTEVKIITGILKYFNNPL